MGRKMENVANGVSVLWFLTAVVGLALGILLLVGCTPKREIITTDLTTGIEVREIIGPSFDRDAMYSMLDGYRDFRLLEMEIQRLRAAQQQHPDSDELDRLVGHAERLLERILAEVEKQDDGASR